MTPLAVAEQYFTDAPSPRLLRQCGFARTQVLTFDLANLKLEIAFFPQASKACFRRLLS